VEDSSTYQMILEEGAIRHARKLLLRQGTERFGAPCEGVISALMDINNLERLDRICERLFAVANWQELLATE